MKTPAQKLIIFIFLILPLLGFSQTRKISGTVLSFNKYPLKNITVNAKKAKAEVLTDEEGKFEIDVKKNDVIRINEPVFVEYSQKIKEEDQELKINLIFENNERNINRAEEAGYMTREDLEYGLEHLYMENNIFNNFVDVFDAIEYVLPEVTIINENGRRGVLIRGYKSMEGSNTALTVVNGVIVDDISYINPVNIISISRLSPAATALYGARGGNGVISIETR